MGNFTVVAVPADDRLDIAVIREVGSVVGSYITEDSSTPITIALRDALAEPLDPSQVLNTAIGFANAVALTTLAVTSSEESAADVVRETLGVASADGPDPDAEVLILRVLVPVAPDDLPTEIRGGTLRSLADYGDAAVRLTDTLGIPRQTLASAVSAAAAQV